MASEKSYILKSLDELSRTNTLNGNDLFYTLQTDSDSGNITYYDENARSITLSNLASQIKSVIAQSSDAINYSVGTAAGNIVLVQEDGKIPVILIQDANGSTDKGVLKLGPNEQNLQLSNGILTLKDNLQFEPGSINPDAITHEKVVELELDEDSVTVPLDRSQNGVSPIYYVDNNGVVSLTAILNIDSIFTDLNEAKDGYEFSVILDYRETEIANDSVYVHWFKNEATEDNKIGDTTVSSAEVAKQGQVKGHFLFFTFKLFKIGNDIEILPINSYIL